MRIHLAWLPAIFAGVMAMSMVACGQENKGAASTKIQTGRILNRSYDFKEAGKKMDYCMFVPNGYDKSKKYPLIVALHGLYATPMIQMNYPGLTGLAQKHGYIVVAPMGYNTSGWYGSKGPRSRRSKPQNLGELSEKDVMNVVAIVRKDLSIDDNRICLMGHSMGGGGTWHLGLKHPKLWAALAPIAPAIYHSPDELTKIKHIPVIVVQGDKDRLVPVAMARRWVAKMNELGMTHEYIEVKGGDHIRPAFQKLPDIFAFFNKYGNKKSPKKSSKPRETTAKDALAAGLNPKIVKRIDTVMQKHIDDGDVAGVVALISRNGKIGYHKALGHQDRDTKTPMLLNVIFRIYSMTKPIVTLAALILHEQGMFDLDDPISKHLPEWKDAMVLEAKTGRLVPIKNQITVRDLMRHSSGMYYGFDLNSKKKLIKAGVYREGITLAEFSKRLAKAPLKFQPGTAYHYGYSIDILGRYVEAVSKKPLDVFVEENIFEPLKMNDTAFWAPDEKKDRIATVYRKEGGKLVPAMSNAPLLKKPAAAMGGQGLVSTSMDYWRFCQMLLNRGELEGVRIAKAKTVELMFQNHLGDVYKDGKKTYGLGGAVDGKGGYRWGGAAGTKFFVDTKNQVVVVYMIQARGYQSRLYPQFQRLVGQAVMSKTQADN